MSDNSIPGQPPETQAQPASVEFGTPPPPPEKRWKTEAVIRLLLSLFICIYAGSVVMSAVHFAEAHRNLRAVFLLLTGITLVCLCAAVILMAQPKKELGLEQLLRWLIPLGAGFLLGSALGLWAQRVAGPSSPSTSQMLVSLLSFQGAAFLLIGRMVHEQGLTWNEAFGFSRHWPIAVLFGLVFGCIFLPIGYELQEFSLYLLKRIVKTQEQHEQQAVQTLRLTEALPLRVLLGALTVTLVPAAEETLFRGILYPWLKKAGFPKLAFLGTSLVFALIHVQPITYLPLFVLALILTGLYEKTNNLLAPISAHALFNAVGLIMLYRG